MKSLINCIFLVFIIIITKCNSFGIEPNMVNLPLEFNVAESVPECANVINTVRQQGQACVADWAVASASLMTDLTCIRCQETFTASLSQLDLLSCCTDCGGCNAGGGNLTSVIAAFDYWKKEGVVTGGPYGSNQGCKPNIFPSLGNKAALGAAPACSKTCRAGYNTSYDNDKRQGRWYQVISGEQAMIESLYNNGPLVVVEFKLYDDFITYNGGIYQHQTENFFTKHAVKVIGYGVENGKKYWLAINSWGTNWGIQGKFKILRGQNECDFEKSAITALASDQACVQPSMNSK